MYKKILVVIDDSIIFCLVLVEVLYIVCISNVKFYICYVVDEMLMNM